jgi:hypothetical protein
MRRVSQGIITYVMDLFGKDDEKAGLSLSEIRLKHVRVNSKGSINMIYGNGFCCCLRSMHAIRYRISENFL